MRKINIIIIIGLFTLAANAQDSIHISKNNLFAEIGGAGLFLSTNYERLFPVEKSITLSTRIGLGIYPSKLGLFGGESKNSGIVPITLSLIHGDEFALEIGLGMSVGWDDAEGAFNSKGFIKWINGIIGFRYQKPNRKFLCRLGYTPHITSDSTMPWFGLSLGFRL